MDDLFMNSVSETAARDAAFTKLMMTNSNISTQLKQQEYQFQFLQAKLCNLKVAAANRPMEVKGSKKKKSVDLNNV